jgi:hypothetical protein
MPHISQIDYETADAATRAAHDEEVRLRGRMTNMKRTLLHSIPAHRIYAEWFALRDELRPALSDREVWLFCHAIAVQMKGLVPTMFFRRAMIENGISPEHPGANTGEQVLIDFGSAIAIDSNAVPDAIWDALKSRYRERTLVNLVAFAGIMVATIIFTNTVAVELDAELERYLTPA